MNIVSFHHLVENHFIFVEYLQTFVTVNVSVKNQAVTTQNTVRIVVFITYPPSAVAVSPAAGSLIPSKYFYHTQVAK